MKEITTEVKKNSMNVTDSQMSTKKQKQKQNFPIFREKTAAN